MDNSRNTEVKTSTYDKGSEIYTVESRGSGEQTWFEYLKEMITRESHES